MRMGTNLLDDAECAITTSGKGLSLPDYTRVGNVYLHRNSISYGDSLSGDVDTQITFSDEQITVGSSDIKVVLPANTTIGGNTPATFGSNVDGSLNQLTVQKISNFDNNSPLEINAQIINFANTDCVWFNGGSISVDPKTSSSKNHGQIKET